MMVLLAYKTIFGALKLNIAYSHFSFLTIIFYVSLRKLPGSAELYVYQNNYKINAKLGVNN